MLKAAREPRRRPDRGVRRLRAAWPATDRRLYTDFAVARSSGEPGRRRGVEGSRDAFWLRACSRVKGAFECIGAFSRRTSPKTSAGSTSRCWCPRRRRPGCWCRSPSAVRNRRRSRRARPSRSTPAPRTAGRHPREELCKTPSSWLPRGDPVPDNRRDRDPGRARRPAVPETRPDTIVLIHGFWVTPRSWEDWRARDEAGLPGARPAYPGFEVEVEALNADPTPIEEVTVPAIVEHLEAVVRDSTAADPDGSLGRRRVHPGAAGPRLRRGRRRDQLGADRGGAGVPPSQLVHVPVLKNPANRHKAVGFTRTSGTTRSPTRSPRRSQALYERYAIPASGADPLGLACWPT